MLILPACFVIGFGFAGAGIAAVTWMRNWQDFDLVQLVMLPMFLFSATFYPITVFPEVIQWMVRALPLYHGIQLVRTLSTGTVSAYQLLDVAVPRDDGPRGPVRRLQAHRRPAAEVVRRRTRRRSASGLPRRPFFRRS